MKMWEHICPVERTSMAVGKGEPCNWCGREEKDEPIIREKKFKIGG